MTEQPMPVPNDRPSIQGLVRQDLEQREQHGIATYGTPLQAHNGRDALRDLYEELLDAACYARQVIEERPVVRDPFSFIRAALTGADKTCPYHGTDFGRLGWWVGQPRCDSCKQPWRVTKALAVLDQIEVERA